MSDQLVAVGVDTGMERSAIVLSYADGRRVVHALRRSQKGLMGNAMMIRGLRQLLDDVLSAKCADTLYVVTERLSGMRGASENNVALMWAVIEAVAAAYLGEENKGQARLILPYPTQLKLFTSGKGNTPKEEGIAHICRRWPQAPVQNDQAEAFALMMFGLCRRDFDLERIDKGDTGEWTEFQYEIATKDTRSRKKPPFEVLDVDHRGVHSASERTKNDVIELEAHEGMVPDDA